MDLDTMLADAAPARHIPLDGPDSPAAAGLYQRLIARSPVTARRTWRPRFAASALAGVTAAVLAAIVALTLIGGPAGQPRPAHGGGSPHADLAAWSVVRLRGGLVRVFVLQLRDPVGLWRMLRADGVPARVVFRYHGWRPLHAKFLPIPRSCSAVRMSDQASAKLRNKIMVSEPASPAGVGFNIRPSAIPHGIGLFLVAQGVGGNIVGALSLQVNLVVASPQCTGRYP